MPELVERYRMDTSQLLQAEADIHVLPKATLLALAGSQSLDDVMERLQRGELFYCEPYPQCPYCLYFRGQCYLNPAATMVATPQAIEQFRSRYPQISIEAHQPPGQVIHGALIRQYYSSSQSITPTELRTPRPEPTVIDEPSKKNQWLDVFFYTVDQQGQQQAVANLPYEITRSSHTSALLAGRTPDNGRIKWQGYADSSEYYVWYGEPEAGTKSNTTSVNTPLAFSTRRPFNTEALIKIEGVGNIAVGLRYDDPWQTPLTSTPLTLENNGTVITDSVPNLGLNDLGRQDGQYQASMRSLIAYSEAPYSSYQPVTITTHTTPKAADEIKQLSQQIITNTTAFQASMEQQLQPWVQQWEDDGLLSIPAAYRTGAHHGFTTWYQGEADFWGSVSDGLSALQQQVQQKIQEQISTLLVWYEALPWQDKLNPVGAYILDVSHDLLDQAQDYWKQRDAIMRLIKAFTQGSVAAIQNTLPLLLDMGGELSDLATLLITHSVEWTQGFIELVRETQVLETLANAVFGIVMHMPLNLWAEAIGTIKGYLLPEILLGLLCSLLALLSVGAASAALAARLIAFANKAKNLLKKAGNIGPLLQSIFDFIDSLTTMTGQLMKALRSNRLETATGKVGERADIVRRSEKGEGVPNTNQAASFGESTSTNYKKTFFEANSETQGNVVVHHAVEQQAQKRYPDLVSDSQLHSLENLRGIPKEINSDIHLSKIRKEWNRFYRENPSPTQQQLLDKATDIDNQFGNQFTPPVRD